MRAPSREPSEPIDGFSSLQVSEILLFSMPHGSWILIATGFSSGAEATSLKLESGRSACGEVLISRKSH